MTPFYGDKMNWRRYMLNTGGYLPIDNG